MSDKRRTSTGIWSFGKRSELEYGSESLQHKNDDWDYKVDISYRSKSQDGSPGGQITFKGEFNDYEVAREIKKACPERQLENSEILWDRRIRELRSSLTVLVISMVKTRKYW